MDVRNNTFYNISVNVVLNGERLQWYFYNNICHVANPSSNRIFGSVSADLTNPLPYEDYNYTNATTLGLPTGANSQNSLTDAQIGFVDAAGGDFRLKPGSVCLNAAPIYDAEGNLLGYNSIGVYQRKQRGSKRGIRNV